MNVKRLNKSKYKIPAEPDTNKYKDDQKRSEPNPHIDEYVKTVCWATGEAVGRRGIYWKITTEVYNSHHHLYAEIMDESKLDITN